MIVLRDKLFSGEDFGGAKLDTIYKKQDRLVKETGDLLKDLEKGLGIDKESIEKRQKAKEAERVAKSKASIAKHEAKANKLRAIKARGKIIKGGIKAAGTAAVLTGTAYGAKKLYDKKKKEDK